MKFPPVQSYSDETGQTWFAAKQKKARVVTTPRGRVLLRRMVFCHTAQMRPAKHHGMSNKCLYHGGWASWNRCRDCPDNWGFSVEYSDNKKHLWVIRPTRTWIIRRS